MAALFIMLAAHPLQEWKAGLQDTANVLASWKEGTNPCGAVAWQGVSCDGWSVVSIQLPFAGLKGPVMEGLMRLQSLRFLQLNDNQLSGKFNNQMGWCSSQTASTISFQHRGQLISKHAEVPDTLSIGSVHLLTRHPMHAGSAGTLPVWQDAPGSLNIVNLASNNLQGTLPDSWSHSLLSMQHLNLSRNALQGELPEAWAAFRHLITL